jgi:alpha-N-arabinofuranosidase
LTLTVVNPHVTDPRETEIVIHGAAAKSGNVTTLTHSDIHAHNTFQQREVVVPQTMALDGAGKVLLRRFPPASVTSIQIHLV